MLTVISKNNCMQCHFTKKWLDTHGFSYVEHNIDVEPEWIKEMHHINVFSAPAVLKDGQVFCVGFDVKKLNKLS